MCSSSGRGRDMKHFNIVRWNLNDPMPDTGVLFIRHGPRHGGSFPSHDVQLTDEGRQKCCEFGKNWDSVSPSRIFSSQVRRCINTGELIARGAGWNIQVEPLSLLGNPGPFVTDQKKVGELVSTEKNWGFLKRHISGYDIPGMRHRDDGCKLIFTTLAERMNESDLILAISHDSIIAAILAYGGLNPDPWPQPLCGTHIK
jgi:broad specificity phosphatase PhoE